MVDAYASDTDTLMLVDKARDKRAIAHSTSVVDNHGIPVHNMSCK